VLSQPSLDRGLGARLDLGVVALPLGRHPEALGDLVEFALDPARELLDTPQRSLLSRIRTKLRAVLAQLDGLLGKRHRAAKQRRELRLVLRQLTFVDRDEQEVGQRGGHPRQR
jgi:uncharacterized membrane protein YccC